MKTLLKVSLLCWATMSAHLVWSAAPAESTYRFSGAAPGKTDVFEMTGPWTVSWTAASDLPELAFMEMHLYDAKTNRFLGLLAQRDGTGQGQRVVREAGAYRIVVTGRNVDWSILVEPTEEDLAALVQRRPDITRIQLVEPGTGVSRDLVGAATGWRADGEKALMLTTGSDEMVKIPFHGDGICPGLADSSSIHFVTSGLNPDLFNAILLENGTRCYIDNPLPSVESLQPAEQE